MKFEHTYENAWKRLSRKIVASYPEFYIIKEDMNDRYFKVDNNI